MAVLMANPIYDSVFKFLMQNLDAAKVLVSALLDTKVLDLVLNSRELVEKRDNNLGILRIDFMATIEIPGGKTRVVTIELQKAKLQSEVMRFRKYLGLQYADENNARKEVKKGKNSNGDEITVTNLYPYPIIPVFILGHKFVDVKEPIIYVDRVCKNALKQPITGLDNEKFIDCLSHDAIVIQLPYLNKKYGTRLEKILAFFDQSFFQDDRFFTDSDNIDVTDNQDLDRIKQVLIKAAADDELRHKMEVEDEVDGELDNRAKEIEILKADKENLVKENDNQAKEIHKLMQEKVDSAKAMKADGMPASIIAKYTGLSEEEIEGL